MTTNVQIKVIGSTPDGGPRHATSKVFIRQKEEFMPLLPDEIVALEEQEAKQLLSFLSHVLEITLNDPTRPSPAPLGGEAVANIDPKDRMAMVKSAIRRMDRKDRDLWTRDGEPLVEVIEGMIGFDISAKERSDAWEVIKADFDDVA